ncbi:MAG: aminotransferase class IV [Planctomycetota bacterium]|nr:aminotransferase class IV [Planctomycetota bacterium]MDA1261752.1 aminotransferase class IV [Planctomycetota bacterium]
MKVWLNGKFVPAQEAKVSLFDSGFQHGVGVFSSMCAKHGRVFRLMSHMERLKASAVELGALEVLRIEPLADAVEMTLAQNNMTEARVRMTVTAGDLKMLKSPGVEGEPARNDPTIAIVVQPPTPYPQEIFERGVRVRIADARVNPHDPFAGHKTLWYWPRLAELQLAAAAGCSEALFFTINNRVSCGAVSNIFVVRNGRLITPWARGESNAGIAAPVLPGVTRGAVIECAQERRISVERADLTIDDIFGADEIFLTNSSWGVLPVVGVEKKSIANGVVGEISQRLRDDYLQLVESETLSASSESSEESSSDE